MDIGAIKGWSVAGAAIIAILSQGTAQAYGNGDEICPPEPRTNCRSSEDYKSMLLISQVEGKPVRSKILWSMAKGEATAQEDFMDPVASANQFAVCVYDGTSGAQPVARLDLFAGGLCGSKLKPCWKDTNGKGYAYKNKDALPDGLLSVKMKNGDEGKAALRFIAKGANVPVPPLPLTMPVTVQFVADNGVTPVCWDTAFEFEKLRNDSGKFKAKGPQKLQRQRGSERFRSRSRRQ